jgi:cytochrome P450
MLRFLQWLLARERFLRMVRPLFGRFAPFDAAYRRDPHSQWRALREEAPVYRSRVFGTWVLTRYEDVLTVLRDKNFTTDRSNTAAMKFTARLTRRDPELSAIIHRNLLTLDGPEHLRLRGLVSKAFTPRRVEALRPRLQTVIDALFDRAAKKREIDLVADISHPFPAVAIAELMGVPTKDQDFFLSCSSRLVQLLDPLQGTGGAEPMREASRELFAYFRQLLAERRVEPRDDLLSAMLAAEEDGRRLDEQDLLALSSLVLVAGHETTGNLIANAALALLRNPRERKRLEERPELMETAVDEFLRFESPIMLTDRAVIADCEIGGQEIRAGQMVACVLGAANRDPERFADPDRLDVTRSDNQHLAFSQGSHFCLGSQLAKLECELAIGTLLRRFPDWTGELEPPAWRRSLVIRGPVSLPVRLFG